MARTFPVFLMSLVLLAGIPVLSPAQSTAAGPAVDSGDTAWVLTAAALVLLMTVPALALFYGGMVKKKNVLSTVYYSFASAIVVSLLWVIGEYSLVFGASGGGIGAWIGDLRRAFFIGVGAGSVHPNAPSIPESVFSMYQMMFAIITVALISGAVVERMRLGGWIVFVVLWSILVYTPLARWVWNPEGWLWRMGALDFAGGLVVHTSSGVSALMLVLLLGPREGFRREPVSPPANIGYVFVGAALLWVGWFGFNAGSAVAANAVAGSAFVVTNTAAAMAAAAWMLLEWIVHRKPTVVGASTGVVAGLVAITPAAGFVSVAGALAIGAVASGLSFAFMAFVRSRLHYDDALDVFSVHGIGGIWGALATGILADGSGAAGARGAAYGNPAQLLTQLLSVGAAALIAVAGTALCYLLTRLITWGRVKAGVEEQAAGLDLSHHGEQLETNG